MSSCESRGNIHPEISETIRFDQASVTYPERPEAPVLKDTKLKVSEGECVAIVGASGSGKSTIASLLQRLDELDNGSVSIGESTRDSWMSITFAIVFAQMPSCNIT